MFCYHLNVLSKCYLWSIDNNGYVFLLSSWNTSWNHINCSISNIKSFKLLAAASWCVWSIGADNELYLYIPKSEIVIRTPEVVIENQRKRSGQFSSKNLLHSDPFEYVTPNYYGKLLKTDLQSFNLPSSRWKWEGDWTKKLKFDGEPTNEGWVYSSNFLRKFQVERQYFTSNVRRRYWQRYRCFHAYDRWLYMAQDSQPFQISCSQDCCSEIESAEECINFCHSGIVDVGCGGEMLPHQKDGFLSVWVVNGNGQILFRLNVHRQNPEGSNWCHIKLPKFVKAISLAVGPLGNLFVCSTTGNIYFRESITWKNPIGTSWMQLEVPHDLWEKEKIVQLTTSIYSILVKSSLGRLWSRANVNLHETRSKLALGNGWNLVATDIRFISCSASGQVFALPNEGNQIFYKSNKSKSTPGKVYWSGKLVWHFEKSTNFQTDNLVCLSASGLYLEADILPASWIPSPFTSHKIYLKNSDSDSDWKIKISQSLKIRDNLEYKNPAFSNFTSPFEQTFWSKASSCYILCFSEEINRKIWLSASLILHHKIRNKITFSTIHIKVNHTDMFNIDYIPFFIESNDIVCLSKYRGHFATDTHYRSDICSSMIIFMKNKMLSSSSNQSNISSAIFRFSSETDVEDWLMAVNFMAFNNKTTNNVDKQSVRAWILNKFHEPFSCPINKFNYMSWQQDGGHFNLIKTGAKGFITWAIGFNGVAWVHSPGWGGSYLGPLCSSKEHLYLVSDNKTLFAMEYQKSKLLLTDMSMIFEPYMWTDEHGNIIADKHMIQPLSKRWEWSDEWSIVVNKSSSENTESENWQYGCGINSKFDDNITWNKNYRYRKWSRTYKTSVVGPWKEVKNNSLKLIDIAIFPGIDQDDDKNHLVLGINRKNKLFIRKGVSVNNMEGLFWFHIRCELKLLSININIYGTIWVICISGFIWRLKFTNIRDVTKISEKDWDKIEHDRRNGKFKELASGDNLTLWAVDTSDHLWVRIFDGNMFTATVGTHWIHVCDNVIHVSCSSQRLIWAVFSDGTLAERIGITSLLPQGTDWDIKLNGIVTNVSIHGV